MSWRRPRSTAGNAKSWLKEEWRDLSSVKAFQAIHITAWETQEWWWDKIQVICWQRGQQLGRELNSQASEGKKEIWIVQHLKHFQHWEVLGHRAFSHTMTVCTQTHPLLSPYACIIYLRCELFRGRTICFLTSKLLFCYQKTSNNQTLSLL